MKSFIVASTNEMAISLVLVIVFGTSQQPFFDSVLKKRIFIIIPLLLVAIIGGLYLFHLNTTAKSAANEAHDDNSVYKNKKSDLRDKMPDPKFDNVSILMMGVDSGEGDKRDKDD